jgi:hypothetical protein
MVDPRWCVNAEWTRERGEQRNALWTSNYMSGVLCFVWFSFVLKGSHQIAWWVFTTVFLTRVTHPSSFTPLEYVPSHTTLDMLDIHYRLGNSFSVGWYVSAYPPNNGPVCPLDVCTISPFLAPTPRPPLHQTYIFTQTNIPRTLREYWYECCVVGGSWYQYLVDIWSCQWVVQMCVFGWEYFIKMTRACAHKRPRTNLDTSILHIHHLPIIFNYSLVYLGTFHSPRQTD